jgi:hypothetical protein
LKEVRVKIGALILLLSSAPATWAGTEVGNGKVYAGPNGVSVTIVPLKTPAEQGVLVAVAGTGSPFDGKLIPHQSSTTAIGRTTRRPSTDGAGSRWRCATR